MYMCRGEKTKRATLARSTAVPLPIRFEICIIIYRVHFGITCACVNLNRRKKVGIRRCNATESAESAKNFNIFSINSHGKYIYLAHCTLLSMVEQQETTTTAAAIIRHQIIYTTFSVPLFPCLVGVCECSEEIMVIIVRKVNFFGTKNVRMNGAQPYTRGHAYKQPKKCFGE